MSWLACTQADVDAINALLPADTRVGPLTDANGDLFLGADLLTDCGEGQTYGAAGDLIGALQPGEPTI